MTNQDKALHNGNIKGSIRHTGEVFFILVFLHVKRRK